MISITVASAAVYRYCCNTCAVSLLGLSGQMYASIQHCEHSLLPTKARYNFCMQDEKAYQVDRQQGISSQPLLLPATPQTLTDMLLENMSGEVGSCTVNCSAVTAKHQYMASMNLDICLTSRHLHIGCNYC